MTQAAPIVIDNFDSTNRQTITTPDSGNPAETSEAALEAIGGFRKITNTRTIPGGAGDPNQRIISTVADGAASVRTDSNTQGFSVFAYTPGGLNLIDGTNSILTIDIIEAEVNTPITFEINGSLLRKVAPAGENYTLTFPFEDFTTTSFANVTSITMRVEVPSGSNIQFDNLLATAPRPPAYTAVRPGDPAAIPYEPASVTTAPLALTNNDDGKADITLDAPFPFYNKTYSQVVMSTNGYLSFDSSDTGGDFSNDSPLPQLATWTDGSSDGPRIYPLHDDLVADENANLHYQYFPEGLRSFPLLPQIGVHVFQWQNVRFFSDPGASIRFTFQALLFDNGTIHFIYPFGNPQRGSGSTSGIQNNASNLFFVGVEIASNTAESIPNTSTATIYPPEIIVTSNGDAGPGTLRQAIENAPTPARITFDPNTFNSEINRTIELSSQALSVSEKPLTIDGSSVGGITLDGGKAHRIFDISSTHLILKSLNLTNGYSSTIGGAIRALDSSSLTALSCSFYENDADNGGGGIILRDASHLRAEACTFFDNGAGRTGNLTDNRAAGALSINGSGNSATLIHCTVANNFAADANGGVANLGGELILESTVIANNLSPDGPDLIYTGTAPLSRGGNFLGNNQNPFSSTKIPVGSPNTNNDYVGSNSDPLDPLFVGHSGGNGPTLINNGGPTLTLMPLPGSLLIDNANSSPLTTLPDQRGVLPVGNPDIGAVQTTWNANLTTAPDDLGIDVTLPSDLVTVFPPDSSPVSSVARAIDDTTERYFNFDEVNSGFDITPALGATELLGFTITSSSAAARGFDPTTFILLGSHNDRSFELIASAQPNFTSASQKRTFAFPFPPAAYKTYRFIFPEVNDPNQTPIGGVQIEEIELIGTPAEGLTPQIFDFSFEPVANSDPPRSRITLTYSSRPDRLYGIQQLIVNPETNTFDFTNLTGTSPDLTSFETTTSATFEDAPKAIFRVIELEQGN